MIIEYLILGLILFGCLVAPGGSEPEVSAAPVELEDQTTAPIARPCSMCGDTGLTLGMPPCPCKRSESES